MTKAEIKQKEIEDVEIIKSMLAEKNCTLCEMADKIGCSYGRVKILINRHGIEWKNAKLIKRDRNIEIIRKNPDKTLRELAAIIGCSTTNVARLAKDNKLSYKPADRRKCLRKRNNTLCWKCKNACGGCSWSDKLKPVNGWEAEKTSLINQMGDYTESYAVKKCPLFEAEKISKGEKIIKEIFKELDGTERKPRKICKRVYINPKALKEVEKIYDIESFGMEFVKDNNVKCFEVEV